MQWRMTRLPALERFARRVAAPPDEAQRCELCGVAIDDRHRHVLELGPRLVRCACRACAVLFDDPQSGGGRWRSVPERVRVDPALTVSDAEWVALGVPVRIAYVVLDSRTRRYVAFYPSPAGPIEADVAAARWEALAERSPLVAGLVPDVEALLVRRRGNGVVDCYLAPIDLCYELIGAVRQCWRGFDGGDEARRVIDDFFARLDARSEPIRRGGAP